MIDILDICEAQLGQHEAAGGVTKFGKWLDAQPPVTHEYADADWCAASAIWCIAQVPGGLEAIGGLHKSDAYVQHWHDRMSAMGRVSRTPKPRRIVFYDWRNTGPDDNHVGILKDREGSTLWVYEGNHNNRYELVERPFDSQVVGFAEWWSFLADDDAPEYVSLGMSAPQSVTAGVPAFAAFDVEYGDLGNAHAG